MKPLGHRYRQAMPQPAEAAEGPRTTYEPAARSDLAASGDPQAGPAQISRSTCRRQRSTGHRSRPGGTARVLTGPPTTEGDANQRAQRESIFAPATFDRCAGRHLWLLAEVLADPSADRQLAASRQS